MLTDDQTLSALLDQRSDPEARAVLEDFLSERGQTVPLRLIRYGGDGGYGGGYGDGGGGSDGGDGGDGDGDGGSGGYGYGGGDGDGDGGSGGYGYGGGGYGSDGYGSDGGSKFLKEEIDMHNGLRIICVPGGYNPYVLVGWLRRVSGDWWELVEARVIRRFGQNQALAALAANGPAGDTELLAASAQPEDFHRLAITRSLRCNVSAWEAAAPRPKDWTE